MGIRSKRNENELVTYVSMIISIDFSAFFLPGSHSATFLPDHYSVASGPASDLYLEKIHMYLVILLLSNAKCKTVAVMSILNMMIKG